jgi:hypothetical protein
MSALLDELNLYGADTAGAMERLVHDESLYMTCLTAFVADPAFGALDDAVAKEDYSQAFDQAHALKGVAGNLGLTPLYTALCEIVEPLRASDYADIQDLAAAVDAQPSTASLRN